MTVIGTVHRAGILLCCVAIAATWVWTNKGIFTSFTLAVVALSCLLISTLLVWVTVRKNKWAPVTAPAYALTEGLAIGAISERLDTRYPGIAIQAATLTFVICFCLLAAYRSGFLRATDKFKRGVFIATAGVTIFYLANFMLVVLFGVRAFTILAGGVPGVLITAVIVVIAALNLVIDFDAIQQCALSGLPKYMEWYAALGLIVTLIWLYTEIVRLISTARRNEEGASD